MLISSSLQLGIFGSVCQCSVSMLFQVRKHTKTWTSEMMNVSLKSTIKSALECSMRSCQMLDQCSSLALNTCDNHLSLSSLNDWLKLNIEDYFSWIYIYTYMCSRRIDEFIAETSIASYIATVMRIWWIIIINDHKMCCMYCYILSITWSRYDSRQRWTNQHWLKLFRRQEHFPASVDNCCGLVFCVKLCARFAGQLNLNDGWRNHGSLQCWVRGKKPTLIPVACGAEHIQPTETNFGFVIAHFFRLLLSFANTALQRDDWRWRRNRAKV